MSEVEDELFNGAVSDEPEIAPEPALQIEQLAEAKAELEAEKTEPEAAELEAEKPPIPPKPEWRLKEDAERARAAETELANERAEKAALRQRLEALERPAPKAESAKEAKPDPLLDPDGYEKYLEAKLEDRLLNDRRENSMAAAHGKYKEEFEEAMTVATSKIDPALKARMQNSRDPGETLMQWHREEKAKAEVGTDLIAYKAKLREEALKDPEFRKAAMTAWRAEASTETNGRPNINIAPSLNGVSRSNALLRSSNSDLPDDQLFAETTG